EVFAGRAIHRVGIGPCHCAALIVSSYGSVTVRRTRDRRGRYTKASIRRHAPRRSSIPGVDRAHRRRSDATERWWSRWVVRRCSADRSDLRVRRETCRTFCIEFAAGAIADSTALIADSVDMFGDAAVYALSLYALERGVRWKAGAALAKGMFILAFGI